MKSRTPDEVSAIPKAHARNFSSIPMSYEVEAEGDKPHGWISRILLTPKRGNLAEKVTDFVTRFPTEEVANNMALFKGADWLEAND